MGSVSGRLVTEWKLNREVIKEAMREISFSRRQQVTQGTIISGTRFKCFDSQTSGLASTLCRRCGVSEDNIQHMLECYEMGEVPADAEGLVSFLMELEGKL